MVCAAALVPPYTYQSARSGQAMGAVWATASDNIISAISDIDEQNMEQNVRLKGKGSG